MRTSKLAVGFAVLEWVVVLPYLLQGPGRIREDWLMTGVAKAEGFWSVPGTYLWQARPVGAFIFSVVFGLFGEHPIIGHLLLVAFCSAAAALMFLVFNRLFSTRAALLVTGLWVLLPTHLTLDHWMNSIHTTAALALTLAGILRLCTEVQRGRAIWGSLALFAIATLCYEAVLPAIAIALIFVPLRLGGKLRFDIAIKSGVPLLILAAYILSRSQERRSVLASATDALGENFVFGLTHSIVIQVLLVVFLVASTLAFVYRRLRSQEQLPDDDDRKHLLIIGALLFIAGFVPFITTGFDVTFAGLGDRGNFLSSIGVAMIYASAILPLTRFGRLAYAVIATAVVATLVPTRVINDADWIATERYSLEAGRYVADHGGPDLKRAFQLHPDIRNRISSVSQYDEVTYTLRFGIFGKRYEIVRDDPTGGLQVPKHP